MGNARRNWHRHWSVDPKKWTATHDSGLIVQFVEGVVFPQPTIGTHCAAEGVGEWTGWLLGGDDALVAWLKANPAMREPGAFRSRITRLMDEAGRVWAREMALGEAGDV
jgi:hypothetical protein